MKFYLTLFTSFFISVCSGQARYDSIVNNFFANKYFNGAVLIANNGSTEYIKSFGIANRQLDIPINNQSKFKICSITKTFVAVLIMQLYESGQIVLTDKLENTLPATGEKRKIKLRYTSC